MLSKKSKVLQAKQKHKVVEPPDMWLKPEKKVKTKEVSDEADKTLMSNKVVEEKEVTEKTEKEGKQNEGEK